MLHVVFALFPILTPVGARSEAEFNRRPHITRRCVKRVLGRAAAFYRCGAKITLNPSAHYHRTSPVTCARNRIQAMFRLSLWH